MCEHPKIREINKMLHEQEPKSKVGKLYDLGTDALRRHWRHTPSMGLIHRAEAESLDQKSMAEMVEDLHISSYEAAMRTKQAVLNVDPDRDIELYVSLWSRVAYCANLALRGFQQSVALKLDQDERDRLKALKIEVERDG